MTTFVTKCNEGSFCVLYERTYRGPETEKCSGFTYDFLHYLNTQMVKVLQKKALSLVKLAQHSEDLLELSMSGFLSVNLHVCVTFSIFFIYLLSLMFQLCIDTIQIIHLMLQFFSEFSDQQCYKCSNLQVMIVCQVLHK